MERKPSRTDCSAAVLKTYCCFFPFSIYFSFALPNNMHLWGIPGRITSGVCGESSELNFQLWELAFGKAAFLLPEQRYEPSNVCLRYMDLRITDTVRGPGYVWMFAEQLVVSVQASAARPVLQSSPGLSGVRVCAWGLHRTGAAVAVKGLSARPRVAVNVLLCRWGARRSAGCCGCSHVLGAELGASRNPGQGPIHQRGARWRALHLLLKNSWTPQRQIPGLC